MYILILEDSQDRIDIFKELFKSHTLFITDKVDEAIKACQDVKWDIMLLDHDLDGRIFVNSREENTGYQFVKRLVETDFQKEALCYVHSMNLVGGNQMINLMHDYGRSAVWIPYPILIREIKI